MIFKQLTRRDMKVIEFLEEFHIARTTTLHELFYPSLLVAQRRLKVMHDCRVIKRIRDYNNKGEYLYYLKRPTQLEHCLLRTDFYREFSKIVNIVDFDPEYTLGEIRSDGFIRYLHEGRKYIAFLEIERSHNPLNLKKYEHLYNSGVWRATLPIFPKIFAVTNKQLPATFLNVAKVKLDLSDANQLRR